MRKVFFALSVWVLGCATPQLPPPAKTRMPVRISGEFAGDTLLLTAVNPTSVPFSLRLRSTRSRFQELLSEAPIALGPGTRRTIRVGPITTSEDKAAIGSSLRIRSLLDTATTRPDSTVRYLYPFPAGRSYSIMQGYHGTVSHNRPSSRYAIDFALSAGDTVCAARDGVVIERVDENTLQGSDRRYEPYANYLTLYHADGVISQYVHLAPAGVLVDVADSVRAGQPIGIVGLTGFTTAPHLHFNVCIGLSEQRRSIPVRFVDRAGAELRPGDVVRRGGSE